MTLDKAIEILEDIYDDLFKVRDPYDKEAIKLGIEALRWRLHCEKVNAPVKYPLLPGETEEVK